MAYRRGPIPQRVAEVNVNPIQHRETAGVHVVLSRSDVPRDNALDAVTHREPGLSGRNIQVFRDGRRDYLRPVAYLTVAIALYLGRLEQPMRLRTR